MLSHIQNHRHARSWLMLSVIALAISGVFSLFVVLPRTPGVQAWIPMHDFFYTALVLHVDLSVLVWMLSLAAMLSSIYLPGKSTLVNRFTSALAFLSLVFFACSPFITFNYPLMNNYVPVLQNVYFFLGLSMFFTAVLLEVMHGLISMERKAFTMEKTVAITNSLLILAMGAAFYLSHNQLMALPSDAWLTGEMHYELLFWGGGHILQFLYTQLMMLAWVWMLRQVKVPLISDARLKWLFIANALLGLGGLLVYTQCTVFDQEYHDMFTAHMRHFGGIIPLVMMLVMARSLYQQRAALARDAAHRLVRNFIVMSIALFTMGGAIGYKIHAINVTIPAHYHGSIVAVTLALMGLTFLLLPSFKHRIPSGRFANWLPFIYGGGQLLHISGLAWSGGYGTLRKTPGAMLEINAQIAMGFMGAGGLIAIVGGIVFIVLMAKALRT